MRRTADNLPAAVVVVAVVGDKPAGHTVVVRVVDYTAGIRKGCSLSQSMMMGAVVAY